MSTFFHSLTKFHKSALIMGIDDLTYELDNYSISKAFQCEADNAHRFLTSSSRKLTVVCQNIRSIGLNLPQMKILIARLQIDVDVIILTECWLSKIDSLPKLNNFTGYSTKNNKTQNEGVVVYIRNDITANVAEPPSLECNCLTVIVGKDTAIIAIYRPPAYNNLGPFFSSIDEIINTLKKYRNIIFTGDINIGKNQSEADRDEYLDLMAYNGLLSAHSFPTRKDNSLDHVFLKTSLMATTLVISTTMTDHYTILINLDNCMIPKSQFNTYKVINYRNLVSDLDLSALKLILSTENVNEATNLLISTIKKAIDMNTSDKKVPCRKKIKEPWLIPGLLRCIKHRDKLHRDVIKDPDNNTLSTTFKRYRNFCGEILKKVRAEYDRSELKKAGKDSRKTWLVIKNIAKLKSNKEIGSNKELLQIKSSTVESVNYVNDYFSNIGKTLADEINKSNVENGSCSDSNIHCTKCLQSFALFDTDPLEIETILNNLKPNCAIGFDGISAQALKLMKNLITPALVHICNLSFKFGVFPDQLKIALIKPIHKGEDKNSITNYRPISILSSVSKILERLINKRLKDYLVKFNLISENQFGFVAGKSTEHAVTSLTDYIVRQVDKNNKCVGIFLDLAKAFDTVSVPILLTKLEKLGVRDVALRLFRSYLTNRFQRVKVDDFISDEASTTYGVPQGSILGPTLFLIYVNDLCDFAFGSGKLVAYADDTALIFSASTWNETITLAEIGLKEVMSWLRINLLTLNLNKTKYLTFSKSTVGQPPVESLNLKAHNFCTNPTTATCDCMTLERVTTIRYLGVIVDECLNWQEHIKILTGRIRKLIPVFKKLRHLPIKSLKIIYYALCNSLLTYCVTIWGGTFSSYLIRTERSQRAVLKVMLSKPYRFPTAQLYSETKVLTVRQSFIQKAILKTHSEIDFDLDRFLKLRRKDRIILPTKFTSAYAHRHICFLGPHLYNKISKSITIYSLNRSKCTQALNTFLISLDYKSTEALLHIDQ